MYSREIIKSKIYGIAQTLLKEAASDSKQVDDKLLHVILSESSQALEFVCIVEDEFGIEFDDDEIDLDFFSSFDQIVHCIANHMPEETKACR